jgi:two-component system alkaline phosphatase synthesis response regulator PhoP
MNWTVLVADDDAFITNVVARKLQNAGLEVIVAMDGREAYERATAQRPDFLITDLQMPVMSGLELCARLTAELPEPIPTILLTAKGFEIDPNAIGSLPILHVMTKPFSPRELLANVQAALTVGAAS